MRLQLHPATVLRFARGLPTLHNPRAPGEPVPMPDAGSIAVIASFAQPQDAATVLGRVPPAARDRLQGLITALQQRGTLIDADAPTKAGDSLQPSLAAMAARLHTLAQDAACLPSEEQQAATDIADAALGALNALGQELQARLEQHTAQRLPALQQRQPLQLHLGAGATRLPGWVAIDADPEAELPLNLDSGLPFADDSVDRIYAAHVLEHLYYPGPVEKLLVECRRVLRPGGCLRLVVPDIEQCIRAYAAGDAAFFAARRAHWPHWPANRTPLEDFLAYAGAGPDPARALDSHKYGYDTETLVRRLQAAGFAEIQTRAYMTGPDAELLLDEHSFAGGAEHAQGHYSLFMEAST